MSFADDLALSKKVMPLQDKIYKRCFGDKIKIIRFNGLDNSDNAILDKKFHIDVKIELCNHSILLGQEKALRHKFNKYNTFTIEFYQNRETKELGEFFNLGAQFYLHGYLNEAENKFVKWRFIKIFDFLEWLKGYDIKKLEKHTRATYNSRASFFYIDYNNIPPKFIYNKNI